MYVKDDEINRIFNEKNWENARKYYKDNVISNMAVIKQGNTYHIDGQVTISNHSHNCHIIVDTSGKITNFVCDCTDCQENKLACGHIGVLLLKFYSLEMSDIPFQFNQKVEYQAKIEAFKLGLSRGLYVYLPFSSITITSFNLSYSLANSLIFE